MNGNMPFVPGGQVDSVFDLDAEQRNNYLRSLGAVNVNPPLPRSKYLRIKATGRVLPWDDLLAEHQDLVECCDVNGNTDPAAWAADVLPADATEEDRELLLAQAQAAILKTASEMADGYRQPDEEDAEPHSVQYPGGAVAFEDLDVDSLAKRLKSLSAQL